MKSAIASLTLFLTAVPAFAAQDLTEAALNCTDSSRNDQVDQCTKIIQAKPLDSKMMSIVYLARGDAYARMGQKDQAIADYKEALKLNPANEQASEGMKYLSAAP